MKLRVAREFKPRSTPDGGTEYGVFPAHKGKYEQAEKAGASESWLPSNKHAIYHS